MTKKKCAIGTLNKGVDEKKILILNGIERKKNEKTASNYLTFIFSMLKTLSNRWFFLITGTFSNFF